MAEESRGPAQANYVLSKQLEGQLQLALKKHKPLDQPVQHLRANLRSAYVTVLLHDVGFAEVGCTLLWLA